MRQHAPEKLGQLKAADGEKARVKAARERFAGHRRHNAQRVTRTERVVQRFEVGVASLERQLLALNGES